MTIGLIVPILFLMALAGLSGFVMAVARDHRPARFFLLFLANLTLIVLLNPVRQLVTSAWSQLFFERLFYVCVGLFGMLLVWMLSQLFAPEWWRGRGPAAPIVAISAPFLLVNALVAIDLGAQLGWFFGAPILSSSGVDLPLLRPGGIALLALLALGYTPALGLLIASFVRQPESRRAITILFAGVLLTGVFGFLNQYGVMRVQGGLLITAPILVALAYVVLQSRLVVPTDIALGQVMRQSADLIVVADRAGRAIYANDQAQAHGFAPAGALAQQLSGLIGDSPLASVQIASALRGEGQSAFAAVTAGRRLRLQLSPVHDSHGYQRGALLVGRDITDVEQRAEDLAARNTEQQRLLELVSTLEIPSVTIADGVLLAPLVGALDSRRAMALTDRLLHAVHTQRTRQVILDISGVPVLDETVAEALIGTARALQLLGCRVVLSGISAPMATELVAQGKTLEHLEVVRSPQDALAARR
jgi:rsbT co-antagonist protein RsbR